MPTLGGVIAVPRPAYALCDLTGVEHGDRLMANALHTCNFYVTVSTDLRAIPKNRQFTRAEARASQPIASVALPGWERQVAPLQVPIATSALIAVGEHEYSRAIHG
jgi:hypothetical protein